jgi:hypothetical protein
MQPVLEPKAEIERTGKAPREQRTSRQVVTGGRFVVAPSPEPSESTRVSRMDDAVDEHVRPAA